MKAILVGVTMGTIGWFVSRTTPEPWNWWVLGGFALLAGIIVFVWAEAERRKEG